jgi:hypothetical protein
VPLNLQRPAMAERLADLAARITTSDAVIE